MLHVSSNASCDYCCALPACPFSTCVTLEISRHPHPEREPGAMRVYTSKYIHTSTAVLVSGRRHIYSITVCVSTPLLAYVIHGTSYKTGTAVLDIAPRISLIVLYTQQRYQVTLGWKCEDH